MSATISRRTLLALAAGTVTGIGSIVLTDAAAVTRSNGPRATATLGGDHLLQYDALGLAELVRAGEVTTLALVQAAAQRITALGAAVCHVPVLTWP